MTPRHRLSRFLSAKLSPGQILHGGTQASLKLQRQTNTSYEIPTVEQCHSASLVDLSKVAWNVVFAGVHCTQERQQQWTCAQLPNMLALREESFGRICTLLEHDTLVEVKPVGCISFHSVVVKVYKISHSEKPMIQRRVQVSNLSRRDDNGDKGIPVGK